MNFLKSVLTPTVRRWMYGVVLALIPILTAVGVVTEELAPMIVALAGALLAIGVADFHVPEAPDYEAPRGKHVAGASPILSETVIREDSVLVSELEVTGE